jgi:hypothetical protein
MNMPACEAVPGHVHLSAPSAMKRTVPEDPVDLMNPSSEESCDVPFGPTTVIPAMYWFV